MKIVIFETGEWERQACLSLAPEHEVTCFTGPLEEKLLSAHPDAEAISCFVNSRLTADVLARLPNLKLIATRSTGHDHIDMVYCASHGVAVCNVPDYGDTTVAEHTFALMLAVVRHIVSAAERTRKGDFSQSGLRGFELRDKSLGVIGTGRIGRRVIEIAKGFGMAVVAYDAFPDQSAAERLGFRYADLPQVIESADVLTLHVPATSDTRNLISDAAFARMKQGSVLINTSRGSVVDVAALIRAISSKKLRAVGLDVLPLEAQIREEAEIFRTDGPPSPDLRELLANHVLLQFENVVVTPHSAYNTDEALRRIIETTLENIRSFARGDARNVVKAA